MSSRAKSSNASTTNTTTVDNKIAADGNAIVARSETGDVTINQLDGGAFDFAGEVVDFANMTAQSNFEALDDAYDFAGTALLETQKTVTQGFDRVAQANAASLDVVASAFNSSLVESRDDDTQIIVTLAYVAGAVAAAWLIFRS